MQHFFVDYVDMESKKVSIGGDDYHHMKDVVRLKIGEDVVVSDKSGQDYNCVIEEYGEEALLRVVYKYDSNCELPIKVYLFQGLPKADKFEFIIQKCVELGVCSIIPVNMKNCVVKVNDKTANKIKRYRAIAESAANQSKRSIMPEVHDVMNFSEAIEYAKTLDKVFVPYECADGMDKTRELFASIREGESVGIFIGPEGGFDDSEIKKATECGFEIITLGKRILRTETAGMYVMSVLSYLADR